MRPSLGQRDAEAVLVTPAPNTTEPIQRGETSYDYFIEFIIAREFIEDYGIWRK
jgi:hypothetical protein